jgi:hypothetical protein
MKPDDIHPGPAEERLRSVLRSLPPPRAEAAYRARLKQDFVSGRLGGSRVIALPVPWHRRLGWRLAPVALAAVAVVVAVANRGPEWTVFATRGDGIAIVDRMPVPLGHAEELGMRLKSGARLSVPQGGEVALVAEGVIVMQVTSGTEITLPRPPGRWFGRAMSGAVRSGIVRVTTGPRFHGARLTLDTPEAAVEVTGTTLAVICEPAGTCVCVYEGVVNVAAKGGTVEPVTSGRRRFVFNDGRSPETAEMRPTERERLGSLRAARDEMFGPAR